MIYFIADTHFHHKNAITFGDRPYQDVADMNQQLIENWNSVVQSPKDEVYIIGDFLSRGTGEQANTILSQLRGKKYLVKGNHESYLKDKDFDASHFEWIKDYHTLKYYKKKFVLFHYPILEWDGYFRSAIHLYGHVHNTRTAHFDSILGPRAVNVGVDLIDYKPISIDEVMALVDSRLNIDPL
ncbi:metallophosphoesterase [Marinilactibacillus kalidii]|uniref:metallophosphoesterase n=1 Tax=Marinilactibacillus kalidii TaxID=2820274 RepID=UPI001ABDD245|nr:metallophosphoesterase [Marinilactibacillus kalidii]